MSFSDFLPIVLFFLAYQVYDIYIATAIGLGASLLQGTWQWVRSGRLERHHLIPILIIIVLGGTTLLLEDERYIKWKPTVVYWFFGTLFLLSHWVRQQTVIEEMMGRLMSRPAFIWRRLNAAWAMFFLMMGVVNSYVVYFFSTDVWVNFKFYGGLGLTGLFLLGQKVYLNRSRQTT